MRMVLAAIVATVGGLTPAAAQIAVSKAQYAGGVLVVEGETSRPYQRVTLDRRFRTKTGRNTRFTFRVAYRPRDCVVQIRAGLDLRPAAISNCRPTLGSQRRFRGSPQGPDWRLTKPRRTGETRRKQRRDEIWRERPIR